MLCSRCSVCDHSKRLVQPTGPVPAQVMLIGEKPGQQEAYKGRVFVGDSGSELDRTYLPLAGLSREQVYVSNAVKCWLGGNNDKPTPEQVSACSQYHLSEEIRAVKPQLIILLGSTACSLLTGYGLEIAKDHGLPFEYTGGNDEVFGDWRGWVWVSYHPAAAMHDTGLMRYLLDDFRRIKQWVKGEWEPAYLLRQQQPAPPQYLELESAGDFTRATATTTYDLLPVDTENDGPRPWSLQFSPHPNLSCFVDARNTKLVRMFEDYLHAVGGIMAHFTIHDLDVLEDMGVRVKGLRLGDTMQEAYHLGNLPQGLKALGWRLLGVRMRSWEDTVLPASKEKLVGWMQALYVELLGDEHRQRVETQLKTKTKVEFKPHPMSGVLKRTLDYTLGHYTQEKWEGSARLGTKQLVAPSRWVEPNPDYDPWERLVGKGVVGGVPEGVKRMLGEGGEIGVMPIVSIANVDRQVAVEYACQDADLTGQLALVLGEVRRELVGTGGEWDVDSEDWDH